MHKLNPMQLPTFFITPLFFQHIFIVDNSALSYIVPLKHFTKKRMVTHSHLYHKSRPLIVVDHFFTKKHTKMLPETLRPE